MNVGNQGGQKAEINMTPMIDVLLVLIIIFMVITPTVSRGLEAQLPQQSTSTPPQNVQSRDIVISVGKDQSIEINRQPVDLDALPERLAALYRPGIHDHLFVRGARDLEYQQVVQVMDIARAAGWDRIGLMTQ
ncbi:MAG: Biopolymer transport protein ExbD/TolR [Candidatus Solibacter sp.]|nr:Biopolymer transport protein ExbD/TolR [Candidatus Solibacter sp.]